MEKRRPFSETWQIVAVQIVANSLNQGSKQSCQVGFLAESRFLIFYPGPCIPPGSPHAAICFEKKHTTPEVFVPVRCAMVKSCYIGDGHPTFNRNPYNGYINPYYWVDDHPLSYGNNGSLDPGTDGTKRLEIRSECNGHTFTLRANMSNHREFYEKLFKYGCCLSHVLFMMFILFISSCLGGGFNPFEKY